MMKLFLQTLIQVPLVEGHLCSTDEASPSDKLLLGSQNLLHSYA